MSTRDVLRDNDARFYALAVGFSAVEWSQPSLCDGWSNHDVLAHLVVGYGAGAGVVVHRTPSGTAAGSTPAICVQSDPSGIVTSNR